MNLRKHGDNDDGNQIIFSKDHFYVKESDEKGSKLYTNVNIPVDTEIFSSSEPKVLTEILS